MKAVALAALATCMLGGALMPATAMADDHRRGPPPARHGDWGHDQWRQHARREHDWRDRGRVYYGGGYVDPPPAVIYAPPPPPLGFSIFIH